MTSYGYFLSCEQYGPAELVDQARRAEAAGFTAYEKDVVPKLRG